MNCCPSSIDISRLGGVVGGRGGRPEGIPAASACRADQRKQVVASRCVAARAS